MISMLRYLGICADVEAALPDESDGCNSPIKNHLYDKITDLFGIRLPPLRCMCSLINSNPPQAPNHSIEEVGSCRHHKMTQKRPGVKQVAAAAAETSAGSLMDKKGRIDGSSSVRKRW